MLGRRVDYDRRREPGMSSGGSLNHTFKLPWVEIGKLFDLHEKVKEDQEDNENYEDMDAEIELGNWACERESIGLPVLNGGREVKHGEKTYVYYTIR